MKNLDLKKSIKTGRVQRTNQIWYLVKQSPSYLAPIMLALLFTILPFFGRLTLSEKVLLVSVGIAMAIFMVLRIPTISRLKRVSGYGKIGNQKRVKALPGALNWTMEYDNEQFAVLTIIDQVIKTRKEIIILYDGQDVLINISSYNPLGQLNLFRYRTEKRLFNLIEEAFEQTNVD